ncbi:MAG: toll/interleukin-1 receptor domain-containing protein [Candidatus Poribacteria bacterium]|nr:toll/interleukin-1 receptor domain-containing protein [Candidatus Poribacteria bacterium]MDE0467049.1 toll/interleukin-1 receptor domain-containing protein [Candidatus Poribacteria bacterium]
MEPIFISYVHENKKLVDKLYQELTARGIDVWRDVQNLKPGGFWKEDIRKGAFFIACFSKEYSEHDETYMIQQ